MRFGLRQIISRFADVYAFTWGYFIFHFFLMLLMRLFLNNVVLLANLSYWLLVILAENLIVFGCYGLARLIVKKYSLTVVLLGSFAIGAVRTAVTVAMVNAQAWGAQDGFWFQVFVGGLFETLILLVWANVNGAYREHKTLILELVQTREKLLEYRENVGQTFEAAQLQLREVTNASLLPQIQKLETRIKSSAVIGANQMALADDLRDLIINQVRPLSENLRNSTPIFFLPKAAPNKLVKSKIFPSSFILANSIFPWATFLLSLIVFIASPFWIFDFEWIPFTGLISFSFLLMLFWIRRAVRDLPAVPLALGIPLLIVFAAVASIPATVFTFSLHQDIFRSSIYFGAVAADAAIIMLTLALLNSLDLRNATYRSDLSKDVEALKIQVGLFEQQLWLAKRTWSMVVHGSVQAALTAAISRLSRTSLDSGVADLVLADIRRATGALLSPPVQNVNFEQTMSEIKATWSGVCEVDVDFAPEIARRVNNNIQMSSCLNEIIKEAVSNAVRHGGASKVRVSAQTKGEQILELSIQNDGGPVVGSARGLGSELLDELTIEWSLTSRQKTDLTVLVAALPFDGAGA